MNAAQYKKAYGLLKKLGLTDQKENIVAGFSTARKTSMRELSHEEARAFLTWLNDQDTDHQKGDKQRKAVISMCHTMGWYKKDERGKLAFKNGKPVIDMASVDAFCIKQGGKKLDAYTYKELRNIVTAFEGLKNSYLKKL